MSKPQHSKRNLIEGRPALVVVDIQAGSFVEKENRPIPQMPDYAGRMAKARVAIDKARARGVPVIFIQEEAAQLFRDIAIAICAGVSISNQTSSTGRRLWSSRSTRKASSFQCRGGIIGPLPYLFEYNEDKASAIKDEFEKRKI